MAVVIKEGHPGREMRASRHSGNILLPDPGANHIHRSSLYNYLQYIFMYFSGCMLYFTILVSRLVFRMTNVSMHLNKAIRKRFLKGK